MRKLLVVALLAVSTPALAEMSARSVVIPCGPTAEIVARLAGEFGEGVTAEGNAGTARMAFYVNAETATWTVVMHMTEGKSCIIADGAEFEAVPLVKPGKGA